MCKGNACGCGGSGGKPGLLLIAVLAVIACAVIAPLLGDILLAAGILLALAIAAGLVTLVYVLRRDGAMWRPQPWRYPFRPGLRMGARRELTGPQRPAIEPVHVITSLPAQARKEAS